MTGGDSFEDASYKPHSGWVVVTPEHVGLWEPEPRAWWFERLYARVFPPKPGSKRWSRLNGMAGKQVICEGDEFFKELSGGITQGPIGAAGEPDREGHPTSDLGAHRG